jgi:formamidopyrimidine-DNA glycosylase
MSGSLRILSDPTSALRKHDHLVWTFARAGRLCLHDPRRFGAVLLLDSQGQHPLLKRLGPEPLSADFTVDVLHAACKGRRQAIKVRIMDASVVVGVGNIYAQEALFMAGIDPRRQAGRISRERLEGLRDSIRTVLQQAVDTGGTTLRDFVNPEGQPGYFAQSLMVYGRGGGACYRCGSRLASTRVAGRTTCWCPSCQT